MFDTFDSRALRLTDTYGQRFMKAGTFRYAVLPAGGHCVTEERPFVVHVSGAKESTGKDMNQLSIAVLTDRNRLRVPKEQEEVTIDPGDLVLWHCANPKALPYMVIGDKEFFGSHRLVNESGYSHAFSAAGDYEWVDAYGSGASGVVRVRDPRCREPADFERWRRTLSKGTVVMISDASPEPREVEIVTGQTVFFAVTKGPGISITDRRVVEAEKSLRPAGHKLEPAESVR